MLQLEGGLTVSKIAGRLGSPGRPPAGCSAVLVFRDFAVQDENRLYRAGPVLELAAHSQSRVSSLRAAALPHLVKLADLLDETVNLAIRTGTPRGSSPASNAARPCASARGRAWSSRRTARRRDCCCSPSCPNRAGRDLRRAPVRRPPRRTPGPDAAARRARARPPQEVRRQQGTLGTRPRRGRRARPRRGRRGSGRPVGLHAQRPLPASPPRVPGNNPHRGGPPPGDHPATTATTA